MYVRAALFLFLLPLFGCASSDINSEDRFLGCSGQAYPPITSSLYVVPFAVQTTIETGLTNCSSSYHGAGNPDQYATDFNMPAGTPFVASRGGTVSHVDESQPSGGGNSGDLVVGNVVVVDHGDGTSAMYLHAPRNGIQVEVGDQVQRGDVLGVVGQSGLAGYPHLHFIVVKGSPAYPYQGIPVSFRNVYPADAALRTNARYEVRPY
jgi:murein DD-endopeptidase MepM/ murein hydrolase activator NlpD